VVHRAKIREGVLTRQVEKRKTKIEEKKSNPRGPRERSEGRRNGCRGRIEKNKAGTKLSWTIWGEGTCRGTARRRAGRPEARSEARETGAQHVRKRLGTGRPPNIEIRCFKIRKEGKANLEGEKEEKQGAEQQRVSPREQVPSTAGKKK